MNNVSLSSTYSRTVSVAETLIGMAWQADASSRTDAATSKAIGIFEALQKQTEQQGQLLDHIFKEQVHTSVNQDALEKTVAKKFDAVLSEIRSVQQGCVKNEEQMQQINAGLEEITKKIKELEPSGVLTAKIEEDLAKEKAEREKIEQRLAGIIQYNKEVHSWIKGQNLRSDRTMNFINTKVKDIQEQIDDQAKKIAVLEDIQKAPLASLQEEVKQVKSKMDQGIANLDKKTIKDFDALNERISSAFAKQEERISSAFAKQEERISGAFAKQDKKIKNLEIALQAKINGQANIDRTFAADQSSMMEKMELMITLIQRLENENAMMKKQMDEMQAQFANANQENQQTIFALENKVACLESVLKGVINFLNNFSISH